MEVVEILGDLDAYESAQVTFRLQNTGEHIVVCLFKSEARGTSDQVPDSLPLVDRLIMLIGRSLTTDDYGEQQALEDEALDPIYQAAETIILSSAGAA